MKSKINFLLSVCLAFAGFQTAQAQVRLDPYYPYSKFTVGIGFGYTNIYGDWTTSHPQPVYKVNIARNVNEWVNLNFDLQHGALNAYSARKSWTSGLSSYNEFTSFSMNGNVSLGELFNWPNNWIEKTIYGIYFGAGVGVMNNDITAITTKFRPTDKYGITYYQPGAIKGNSYNAYIPLNLGINLHLTRVVMINACYQFDYTFSDYVDGYNFKSIRANNYNDMYSTITVGLHFYIGTTSMTPNRL
ncbi:MAG: hypothetical protein JWQ38_531 [Flavipsychrobacter sp.]|nr:hypothetical protein [Flavipsychrobacter sp.]